MSRDKSCNTCALVDVDCESIRFDNSAYWNGEDCWVPAGTIPIHEYELIGYVQNGETDESK